MRARYHRLGVLRRRQIVRGRAARVLGLARRSETLHHAALDLDLADDDERAQACSVDAWFAEAPGARRVRKVNSTDAGWRRATTSRSGSRRCAWRLTRHYLIGVQKRPTRGASTTASRATSRLLVRRRDAAPQLHVEHAAAR